MARIGIDATSIAADGKGVSRYQRNLVKSLASTGSKHEYFVFLNRTGSIEGLMPTSHWHFIRVPIWKSFLWDQFDVPRWIDRLKIDLFHTSTDRLPWIGRGKFILQVFEIPHHRIRMAQRKGHPYSSYERIADFTALTLFPHSLRRAERILVSSRNTEKELCSKYQIDQTKARFIPLAHEPAFTPLHDPEKLSSIRKKWSAPSGYILHLSTGDPRENTHVVLDAFKAAQGKIDPRIRLLIPKRYLTEAELIEVFQGALLYVDPSLYEGFALQVLEAMACGVPVVASNRSSIPEIAGDSGVLIDPEDPEAVAQAMIKVVSDEKLQREMCRRGLERAKEFTWERTARETLRAYEEILNGNPAKD